MSFCHQRGVAHGSLGPGSILLNTFRDQQSRELIVKLDNLGFAQLHRTGVPSELLSAVAPSVQHFNKVLQCPKVLCPKRYTALQSRDIGRPGVLCCILRRSYQALTDTYLCANLPFLLDAPVADRGQRAKSGAGEGSGRGQASAAVFFAVPCWDSDVYHCGSGFLPVCCGCVRGGARRARIWLTSLGRRPPVPVAAVAGREPPAEPGAGGAPDYSQSGAAGSPAVLAGC